MAERQITVADLVENVETASKIARTLSEKYLLLDAADLNSKFGELASLLNSLKMGLFDFQNQMAAKNKQISDLDFALKYKGKLVCRGDALYETDEKGKPIGDANCVNCWENTYKKRKLIVKHDDSQVKVCPTCKQTYARTETENIKKKTGFFKFLNRKKWFLKMLVINLSNFYPQNRPCKLLILFTTAFSSS